MELRRQGWGRGRCCLRTAAEESGLGKPIALIAHRLEFNVSRPIHGWIGLGCLQPHLFAGMAPCQRRSFRLVEVETGGLTCVDRDCNMETDKSHAGETMLTTIDRAHDRTGSRQTIVIASILLITEARIR